MYLLFKKKTNVKFFKYFINNNDAIESFDLQIRVSNRFLQSMTNFDEWFDISIYI